MGLMAASRIERAGPEHMTSHAVLRAALWVEPSAAEHAAEIRSTTTPAARKAAFLAFDSGGRAIGFVEVSLRHDYVNGCDTSPVAFLEGVYVRPDARRSGVAKALCAEAESWGRLQGCTEIGSDAEIGNRLSHRFHLACGFVERERVVFFSKAL